MQRQCANSQLETTFAKGTKLAKLPAFAAHKNAGALTFPKKKRGALKAANLPISERGQKPTISARIYELPY